ncbi:unnamed protein product [Rangifer tarandus platyrhynchus]|uniref:Uncharacterized protein n=1 Tax=Rangifer tarandus platyrhynchus TaxID=3082113 RepID=A0AC59YEH5_RANTA
MVFSPRDLCGPPPARTPRSLERENKGSRGCLRFQPIKSGLHRVREEHGARPRGRRAEIPKKTPERPQDPAPGLQGQRPDRAASPGSPRQALSSGPGAGAPSPPETLPENTRTGLEERSRAGRAASQLRPELRWARVTALPGSGSRAGWAAKGEEAARAAPPRTQEPRAGFSRVSVAL